MIRRLKQTLGQDQQPRFSKPSRRFRCTASGMPAASNRQGGIEAELVGGRDTGNADVGSPWTSDPPKSDKQGLSPRLLPQRLASRSCLERVCKEKRTHSQQRHRTTHRVLPAQGSQSPLSEGAAARKPRASSTEGRLTAAQMVSGKTSHHPKMLLPWDSPQHGAGSPRLSCSSQVSSPPLCLPQPSQGKAGTFKHREGLKMPRLDKHSLL